MDGYPGTGFTLPLQPMRIIWREFSHNLGYILHEIVIVTDPDLPPDNFQRHDMIYQPEIGLELNISHQMAGENSGYYVVLRVSLSQFVQRETILLQWNPGDFPTRYV